MESQTSRRWGRRALRGFGRRGPSTTCRVLAMGKTREGIALGYFFKCWPQRTTWARLAAIALRSCRRRARFSERAILPFCAALEFDIVPEGDLCYSSASPRRNNRGQGNSDQARARAGHAQISHLVLSHLGSNSAPTSGRGPSELRLVVEEVLRQEVGPEGETCRPWRRGE